LSLQQPIIIEKKTVLKEESQFRRTKMNESAYNSQANLNVQTQPRKKVEPWVPVNIPPREKKLDIESMNVPTNQGNNNK
jgi:hypothetical protein